MEKIAFFVDGSNLLGSLTDMSLNVPDYSAFFSYLFKQVGEDWSKATLVTTQEPKKLLRVYWYVVGSMDEWDLDSEKSRSTLRDLFEGNRDLRAKYMAEAGGALASRPPEQRGQDAIRLEAWTRCFTDLSKWYVGRSEALAGMKRFYHGVRSSTDVIDVIEVGHWQVDMMGRRLSEKGLDVSLAVDMVALNGQYDLAVIISGDADMLPSIRYCKEAGKHVGAIEFLKGYPPDKRSRSFSTRLRLEADVVTRIYEMDLIREGIGQKRDT